MTSTNKFSLNDNTPTPSVIERVATELGYLASAPTEAAKYGLNALILKGATSAKTPNSMSVRINDTDEKGLVREHKFTKAQAIKACDTAQKGLTLRNYAEANVSSISLFAQENGIYGDLATQINNRRLAEGESPLTAIQKSWCSSFNQNNPDLEKDPDLILVAQLLAKDYIIKFKSKKVEPSKNQKPSPKRQGPGKKPASKGKNKKGT